MDDPRGFFGELLRTTAVMVLLMCVVMYLLVRCGG